MKKNVIFTFLIAAVLLLAGANASGCGDDKTTSVTSVNTIEDMQAAYDHDVQALKDSVANFQNPSTYTSVDNIKSAFRDIENSYNNALASGKQVKDAKISTLKDSYENLKTTVSNIAASDQTLQQKVDAVKTALQTFKDQLQQI